MKIIITRFTDSATLAERSDVTIGREYEVVTRIGDTECDPFFYDDSGDKNFGCDLDNSVYEFTVQGDF